MGWLRQCGVAVAHPSAEFLWAKAVGFAEGVLQRHSGGEGGATGVGAGALCMDNIIAVYIYTTESEIYKRVPGDGIYR